MINRDLNFRNLSKKSIDLIVVLLTVLLSVVVLLFSIHYANSPVDPEKPITTLTLRHFEFDNSFYKGIEKDANDLAVLKKSLSTGNSFYTNDFIREIMLFHMDIVFLLGLVFGKLDFYVVFVAAFILKFGLMGGVTALFLRKALKLQIVPTILLSVAYSVSGIFMAVSINTAMVNMMLIFPITLLFILNFAREGGKRGFALAVTSVILLATTGVYGITTGLTAVLLVAFIMVVGTRNANLRSYVRIFISWIMGVFASAIIIVPSLFGGYFTSNAKSAFINGKMNYTFFDALYRFMDGNIIGGSASSKFPAVGISLLVVILLILFFINESIPYRFKLFSGVALLLSYISVSYSALNEMIMFKGAADYSFAYSRILVLSFFVIVLAAISFRNISSLKKGEIYGAVFAVIIFIILSNSSKTEVVHGTVSLYLSGLSAIVSGCLLISCLNKKVKASYALMAATFVLISINAMFCLAPSNFPSKDLVVSNLFDSMAEEKESFIFTDSNDQYIISSADISRSIVTASPYEQVNMLGSSLFLDDVFTPCECYPVYYSGVIELGDNKYGANDTSDKCMLNIRINKNNKDDICYLSSSYIGGCTLRLVYDDYEKEYYFDGPFLFRMDNSEESFVAALDFSGTYLGTFELKAVVLNMDAADALKACVRDISNQEINLSSNSSMMYMGTKSVLTSLRYSPKFEVIYTKDGEIFEAETFNFDGYLAFNVVSGGFEHQQAKVLNSKTDLLIGFAITDLTIISFILITFMYNRYRRLNESSKVTAENATGEEGLDKQEN